MSPLVVYPVEKPTVLPGRGPTRPLGSSLASLLVPGRRIDAATLPAHSRNQLENFRDAQLFWASAGSRYRELRGLSQEVGQVSPFTILKPLKRVTVPELGLALAMSRSGRAALEQVLPSLAVFDRSKRTVPVFPFSGRGLFPLSLSHVRSSRDLCLSLSEASERKLIAWMGSVLEHGFREPLRSGTGANISQQAATKTLSAMSYNVMGLPWALGFGAGMSWRFHAIGQALRGLDLDIVALQEMFCPRTGAVIEESGFPHVARSKRMHGALGLFGGSGLAILSKHPILLVKEHTFNARSGVERHARKGLLLARIRTPLGLWDVLTGHLASPPESLNCWLASKNSADRVREAQLHELSSFLERRPNTSQVPLLSLGDWNIDETAIQYRSLSSILGTDLHRTRAPQSELERDDIDGTERSDIAGYTFDPDRNDYAFGKESEPSRLDYIFLKGVPHEQYAIRSQLGFVEHGRQFSDHFAPRVDIAAIG